MIWVALCGGIGYAATVLAEQWPAAERLTERLADLDDALDVWGGDDG